MLRDAGAAAVVCSTMAQVEKIRAVKSALPSLRHVIVFDGRGGDGVVTLAELEARGRAAVAKYPRFKEEALSVQPADLATLLYTSGTTGPPKGVMLTHDNICSNVRACVDTLRVSEDDTCLALLPLSHILERMVDYYFLHVGVTIVYAESIDRLRGDDSAAPDGGAGRRRRPRPPGCPLAGRSAAFFSGRSAWENGGRRTASPASGCLSA